MVYDTFQMISLLLFAAINPTQQATRIVVTKSEHTLTIYHDQTKLRTYKVSLGSTSGQKQQAGDRKTPEGLYTIDGKIENSRFHHAFHLSYPNPQDRDRAQNLKRSPGGDIEIHGQMNSLAWIGPFARHFDWTAGCIALTNDEIDAIWNTIAVGTPVEIDP
jgi:murein L,D-transpeptidase YafK